MNSLCANVCQILSGIALYSTYKNRDILENNTACKVFAYGACILYTAGALYFNFKSIQELCNNNSEEEENQAFQINDLNEGLDQNFQQQNINRIIR